MTDEPTAGPWPSVPAMVRESVARHHDREALVDAGERWTFGQLGARIDEAARAAIGAGIRPGDHVGLWAPNVGEYIVAALGALAAGARLVPLNTRYKGREAAYILERARVRMLFTLTDFLDTDYVAMLRDAAGGPGAERPVEQLPDLDRVVVLRGAAPKGTVPWAEHLRAGGDVDVAEVDARIDALGPDDVCDVMFTSGTTGRPKGVLSTHGQTLRAFEAWSRIVGLEAGDRYLVVNPFFHTFGYKAGFLAAIMRGAVTIPHAVFDADQVLRRIGEESITMLPGPPALYQSILNHPELGGHDLSSLRLAVTGAASIPVSLIERMHDDLGFETVLTAYGLTEANGVVTMCRHGDDAETIATTSGRAIPDVEVRIVADDGRELSAGQPGEIVVRGYNVMRGYLDDPEQTAQAIDADGWLHTGDIGVMDERGYVDITDRKKDMFIVGGFNAYPAEIENDLLDHPAIAQVAVVGMPDDRLGEVGCAFVVPTTGERVDPEQVVAWARDRIANFKVPRRVEVVEQLPTNASGKVLKHELRERVKESAHG